MFCLHGQAYYGNGMSPLPPPPGYFPSAMGSGPQPHPYMWGGQVDIAVIVFFNEV